MSPAQASIKKTGLVLLSVFVIGGTLVALLSYMLRDTSTNPLGPAIQECRGRYSQALTLADTMRVELVYPQHATTTGYRRTLTCGDLRRAALLGYRVGEAPPVPGRATMGAGPGSASVGSDQTH